MPVERCTLKNGLTVLIEPFPAKTVAVRLAIRAGSMHEVPKFWGAFHMIEHLLFKSNSTMSTREISEALEQSGGHANASAGVEVSQVFQHIRSADVPGSLAIMCSMFRNASYQGEEFANEKDIVLQELSGYQNSPLAVLDGDVIDPWLYAGSNAARKRASEICKVRLFSRKGIEALKARFYVPVNTIIVLSGGIDCRILETIEELFGDLEPGVPSEKNWPVFLPQARRRTVLSAKVEQGGLLMTYRIPSANHEDAPALLLLSMILGNGMSSRLFQRIREEKGIGYYISAGIENVSAFGVLQIAVGDVDAPFSRLSNARDIIHAEICDIQDHGVTESELVKAQNTALFDHETGEYNTLYRSQGTLNGEIYGFLYDYNDFSDIIDQVTLEDVQRAARKHLRDEDSIVAMLIPKKKEAK